MKSDFEMIVKELPNAPSYTVYAISDVHLGALEHNQREWINFCRRVEEEENSYVFLGGDLINNATRSSVSNIFEETMRPREQKKLMVECLKPIKHKILAAVSGNHERRSIKDADDDPTYDILAKLDLEDIYRPNIAFIKLNCCRRDDGKYRNAYVFALTHGAGGGIYTGATVNRNERFGYVIDGIDCLIVGHTHKGTVTKPQKILVDAHNNNVVYKPFTVIGMTSWMNYGGYAVQKMLLPSHGGEADYPQKIILNGTRTKRLTVEW